MRKTDPLTGSIMNNRESISPVLKDLVSKSVKLLGQAIENVYGKTLFSKIEDLRLNMKSVRAKDPATVSEALELVYKKLQRKPSDELHRIAKAFALMLELTNSCESAYRTYRLKGKNIESAVAPQALVFVFTSHPTEARSHEFLHITDQFENLLINALEHGFDSIHEQLLYLLRMALRIDLANNRRPQVKDEAEQIYHTVLDDSILLEQIALKKKGVEVFFRTWVGGDKDGHPKVNEQTMLQSMTLSRNRLISFIEARLQRFESEIKLTPDENKLLKQITVLKKDLRSLRNIRTQDGLRVKKFKAKFIQLIKASSNQYLISPELKDLENLLWMYPALVLPLEIREDRELIHEALKKPGMSIAKMLVFLKKISSGLDAKWYVRGFIISMCQSTTDYLAAVKLTKKMCGSLVVPIVPLFENEKGLNNSIEILRGALAHTGLKKNHLSNWGGRFEVMLGYSDSSKENGVLPSRLLVEKGLLELEKFIQGEGLVPVFFHGSGGSASRGGGTMKEQIAWLPQSALNIYKVTIQGESVQRQFHQPLIMRSQVAKIVEEYSNYKPRRKANCPEMEAFASDIQNSYKFMVNNPGFQELASKATPYDFLNLLKIGSRPTKRNSSGKFSLRAIPWILCWTQTRLLFPFWWGVGSAWKKRSIEEKECIKRYYNDSPLLQSYVKALGFTIAKMELGIWKFQVDHAVLTIEEKNKWFNLMVEESNLTEIFFKEITGVDELTWFNPRLGESIIFRSSMIHPLNVIQKISLERKDHVLLRETVTGIACGMMTTG